MSPRNLALLVVGVLAVSCAAGAPATQPIPAVKDQPANEWVQRAVTPFKTQAITNKGAKFYIPKLFNTSDLGSYKVR